MYCLQWARDEFAGLFTNHAEIANQYLKDGKFFERTAKLPGAEPIATLEQVYETLVKTKPHDFSDCVKWARIRFQVCFLQNTSFCLL